MKRWKTEARETEHGLGVFARETIAPGYVIGRFDGLVYRVGSYLELPSTARDHALQIGPDLWRDTTVVDPEDPQSHARIANHICGPCGVNCRLEEDGESIVAVKTIPKGGQARWDYRTAVLENTITPHCLCGSRYCTGRNRPGGGHLNLPLWVEKRYLQWGWHIPDWLLKRRRR